MRPATRRPPVGLLVVLLAALGTAGAGGGPERQDTAVAERLLAEGQRLEGENELQAALEQYTLLVEQFPQSAVAPEALLRLTQGHWLAGNADAALQAAEHLRNAYGGTPSAAGALVLEGEIQVARARALADLEAAQATFNRVPLLFGAAQYPGLQWRSEALVQSGTVSLQLGRLNDAATAFLTAIENERPFAGTPQAQIGLATVFLDRGQWTQAAEILQRVVDASSGTDGTGEGTGVPGARRLLSLIHRTVLRPAIGQAPWARIRRLTLAGASLQDPIGIDAKHEGRLVVALDRGPLAAVVDPNGQILEQIGPDDLRTVWWGPRGAAYALSKRAVFDPGTRIDQSFEVPTGSSGARDRLDNLEAGARGILGDWFLLDTDPRRVLFFEPGGTYRSTLMEENEGPRDLATDARGRLFVLHEQGSGVVRFNAEGVREGRVVTGEWERPEALAVDRLGNLYVLDRDEKTIDVFTPAGQSVMTIGPQLIGDVELDDPRDIAIDDTGRLYIADRGLDAILILE